MIETLKKRVAREESGFTLIELLVVIIILGILLAIAVPSYLSFKDRANKSAAQSDVRALIPSVESFNADNTGTSTDADASASTSGYNGVSMSNLVQYDASLNASDSRYQIDPSGWNGDATASYCVAVTISGWTAVKAGPAGSISVGKTFTPSTCSVA